MPGLLQDLDPDGLLEYSVVYTDRTLNHMSRRFQQVMLAVQAGLKAAYQAEAVALVPGGGTAGMEAVARQFATGQPALVVRNGFFSYRWSQILEVGGITADVTVCKARPLTDEAQAPWAPAPLAEVQAAIAAKRPAVVFAPHVETASGMQLPDAYLQGLAEATHAAGGLLVLDCIASGTQWVDMAALGVDVLISAPQKGWSSAPGFAMVMFGPAALARLEATTSTSFMLDLKKWRQIMQAYEAGGHAYHATLPTTAITELARTTQEMQRIGLPALREQQQELGRRVRALLAARGFPSVAAPDFAASGVVVCHTLDPEIQSGRSFIAQGLQIAAGVPLMCDEPASWRTFRLGLFGLDKWADVDGTVQRLTAALDAIQTAG